MSKKIISLITALSLSIGFVNAETVSLNKPGDNNLVSDNTGSAINVIEKQLTSIGGSSSLVDGAGSVGNPNEGSNGVSSALGYLTPTGDFGYMGLDMFYVRKVINGAEKWSYGTMKTYVDDLGVYASKPAATTSSGKPYADTNTEYASINNKLYERAKDSFIKASQTGGVLRNTLENLTADDIIAGSKGGKNIIIQEANDGRKFVALTMYLRWMYDTNNGYNNDESIKFKPVLNTNYTQGPYIGTGDFFTDYRLVSKDTANSNAGGKYVKRLVDVAHNGSRLSSGAYLNQDLKVSSTGWNSNGRALWEKKFEYRRYITEGDTTNPADKYEVVYPVTKKHVKENSTSAPTGLEASIESNTVYTDSTKTNVSNYNFTIKIKPLTTTKTYSGDKTYTQDLTQENSTDESVGVEPGENQGDAWHNIISRKLIIVPADGGTPIERELNSNYCTISLRGNQYESLDMATAYLEVEYTTSVRYMSKKETYSTQFKYNGTEYDKTELISTLETKNGFIDGSKTTINNFYTSSKPRIEKTYVTATSDIQKLRLSDAVDGPYQADPVQPKLELTLDPPNALTKLEGGKFDINMKLDTNGLPIGNNGTDYWISDFKIDSLVVTAENGEIVYEHETTIDDFTNSDKIVSIRDVTANPSHIGKATVTATYSYNFNKQEWESPAPIRQPDGSFIYPDKIKGDVITTPHYGTVTAYFNIYSLTGVTT